MESRHLIQENGRDFSAVPKKGAKVYIEGRLQTRKWQDQSGQDRYTTEIVANDMQMLDSGGQQQVPQQGGYQQPPQNQQRSGYQQPPPNNSGYGTQQPQGQRPPQRQPSYGAPDPGQYGAFDDTEIPF